MEKNNIIKEKLKESVFSILPTVIIVSLLCFALIPVETGLMLSFFIGAVLITVGMALFTIGADTSMTQIGTHIGAKLTKTRKLWLILLLSFALGVAVTVAEPDLQVLANNVPTIDTTLLIITVSAGVGLFLTLSMLRILLGIPLKWILIVCYAVVFALAAFSLPDFLPVSFDSGGVTTGPITVPFIMALGIGVASARSDERAKSDSFGLVALCSVGPILAVLILGFISPDASSSSSAFLINRFEDTVQLGHGYLSAFPECFAEVSLALLPIFVFFALFQIFSLKLNRHSLLKILIGFVFTYLGLVLFLTGVNVGFSSLGYVLGINIADSALRWIIIPLAMLMGWFIISAEPAVHVLNKNVAELSAGAISEKTMGTALSVAIAAAMGLSMIRVLTGISVMWFILPGYAAALILALFVSPTFTAIAFDAGGVASGPLTATFMLPFAMGISTAVGGNIMTDAFGLVALVAMMPLITVQTMGAISMLKSRRGRMQTPAVTYADDETIELWEVK